MAKGGSDLIGIWSSSIYILIRTKLGHKVFHICRVWFTKIIFKSGKIRSYSLVFVCPLVKLTAKV